MTDYADFAGVFIERRKATIVTAQIESTEPEQVWTEIPDLKYTYLESLAVDEDDPRQTLRELIGIAREHVPNLRGLGVASYGPFLSLDYDERQADKKSNAFGVIDKDAADPPFCGIDLFSTLGEALKENDYSPGEVKIDIQTDAVAGALAEAHFRSLKESEILVYIILTDGVGGGFVKGQHPWRSALHSEMGLLPVKYDKSDPLPINPLEIQYGDSICDRVGMAAMLSRAQMLGYKNVTPETLTQIADRELWMAPASYVAQLCVACTGLLAPHHIVVGGPLSDVPGLINDIRGEFKRMMSQRRGMRYPKRSDVKRFIQSSSASEGGAPDSSIAGALYLGVLATSRA